MPRFTVGNIALSFHAAAAGVVKATLERWGHATAECEAPHEEMFAMLGRGEVDMLVTAWLPASHGRYFDPLEHDLLKLGLLYRPYCIWGVPDYVSPSRVGGIEDLARPEIAKSFLKRVQGIGEGAGISRFSRAILREYALDVRGFHFENGTLADCANAFEDAVAKGENCVVPLWHPQFLHHKHKIRALRDPKGLLGGVDDAFLVIRKEAAARLDESEIYALHSLTIGNAALAGMDHAINREGKSARQAAEEWLGETQSSIGEEKRHA
jgi:glycine betaine/proline transport system substrate-binding protein